VRIVLLACDQPNQHALAHKLAASSELVTIVVSANEPRRAPPRRWRIFLNRVEGRLVGRPFVKTWKALMARYEARHSGFPAAPRVPVRNVNDQGTIDAIEASSPDLVVVSGTNLVGRAVIEAAQRHGGIVNLHTGISPYVKGSPNCTNWCLATGRFEMIGNTVMWLDPGIDSGDLIATERTPLDGTESLLELHWKVMEHAHDLYCRCVRAIGEGQTVARIPQRSIAEGHTYYRADWSALPMLAARWNYRTRWRPGYFQQQEVGKRLRALKLVQLSS
jgi:folate-dependent phosphoribosylglycinamide formyltransferase PurN